MAEVAVAGGAGGGAPAGGGAAPPAPAGGGAPPPAAAPAGGGAAPVPAGGGSGGAGAAPPAGPKYLERKVMRDGKEHSERVREDALWNAHSREANMNRALEERVKAAEAAEARAQALQAQLERVTKGGLRTHLKENKLDPIAALAEELQAAIKEEEQNADPKLRPLLEAARERDELKAKLDGITGEQQKRELQAAVDAEMERLSSVFVPALKLVKLPKNDVTMRLMAEAFEVNRARGLGLTAEQLAQETQKATASMVEGLSEGIEDDEELLEMFPKFARRLHAGLLKRHKRMSEGNQLRAVPPPKPEDRKPTEQKNGEQRVLRPAEEDKAYFGNKRVLRSGI